ncbi:hypothetical protein C8R44DRAFT_753020 [Mycena epipterygia]|nr:hypothetical protein C8R44DRAFT_753020 [Mycena epipterygia]
MAVPLHGKCDFTCKNARVISCRAWEHHPELHARILYEERRDPSSWDPINVLNFHGRSTTDESLNKADDSKTLASRQALAQSGLKREPGGTTSNGTQHHTQQKTVISRVRPLVKSPSAPIKSAEGHIVNIVYPQTLGGGSSVNSMLGCREFNHLAELGHPSLDYASLKPYFFKSGKNLSQTSDDRGYSSPWIDQTFLDLLFKVHHKPVRVKDTAIALGFADVSNLNSSTVPVDVCTTVVMGRANLRS